MRSIAEPQTHTSDSHIKLEWHTPVLETLHVHQSESGGEMLFESNNGYGSSS